MDMRFAIATPCYESLHPAYVRSLLDTRAEFDFEYLLVDHIYTPFARETLVELAQNAMVEGILWIDADMGWSVADVKRVVGQPNVVGAIYPARKEMKEVGNLDHLGFGFIWTPMEAFIKMPRPWFHTAINYDTSYHWIGEDVWFCRRAREYNVQVEQFRSPTITHAFQGMRSLDPLVAAAEFAGGPLKVVG